jgi:hypothetical protein
MTMRDLIFVGLTLAFYALSVWLVAFSDRIMPAPARERAENAREDAP